MSETKRFIINGDDIDDIPSFYKEINRLFMTDEDWKIGQSLDALNDLFHGGIGKLKSGEKIDLTWKNIAKSKSDLGLDATVEFYKNKQKHPSIYNIRFVEEKLTELEQGTGQTYFDIIMEIIESHPHINLIEG